MPHHLVGMTKKLMLHKNKLCYLEINLNINTPVPVLHNIG